MNRFRILQRICWNEAGWRMPTGSCLHERGFPGDYGFGVEEWNFRLDDAFAGHVYGYAHSRPDASLIAKAGGKFDVGFWARKPRTGQKLLVGEYRGASLALEEPEERAAVVRFFGRTGRFRRRSQELHTATGYDLGWALSRVRQMFTKSEIQFKCPVGRVKVYRPPYKTLPAKIAGKVIPDRFNRPVYVDYIGKAKPSREPAVDPEVERALTVDEFYRESRARRQRIIPMHNRLSNSFKEWLRSQGIGRVSQERSRVDITFTTDRGTYLAELKVCDRTGIGATRGIREALGQLLEYNLYPGRTKARNWMVVLDVKPSTDDLKFMKRVSVTIRTRARLYLAWPRGDGFKLDGPCIKL